MTTPHHPIPGELETFVHAAKAAGVPEESIVGMLRLNGWSERRAYGAVSAYYTELLGVARP